MAAESTPTGNTQLVQLNHARNLALEDPSMYTRLLPAVLPMIGSGSNPSLELRMWGAEFLAEVFASPTLPSDDKQLLSLQALPVLKELLELVGGNTAPLELAGMMKNTIQAATSIYPLVFRHIVKNPEDLATWQIMGSIKSNVLRRMDTELPGVRICCIKFVERIVQTQTPGVIPDPRRPDQNEISLALVPPDHPILPPTNMEAEAHGLLDRVLSILQEDYTDPLLITATINGLGALMKLRSSLANKIINAVLNFNPFRMARAPVTVASRLIMRSIEKTVCVFLTSILKRAPQHPLAPRIDQHIGRLHQLRKDLLEGVPDRKRPAIMETTDGTDKKRQRVGVAPPGAPQVKPAPVVVAPTPPVAPITPAPLSYAQLFSLTDDPNALNMNVQPIPADMAARTLVLLLQDHVDTGRLEAAINAVRNRYNTLVQAVSLLTQAPANGAVQAPPHVMPPPEDEEDYEPDFEPTEDAEMIKNRMEMDLPEDIAAAKASTQDVAQYRLPRPEPLSDEQLEAASLANIERMFATLDVLPKPNATPGQTYKRGFHEPVIRGALDRDSYFRLIVRVAVRPTMVAPERDELKKEERGPALYGDLVRHRLLQYILSDWQHRIGYAVTWFTEEWLAEQDVLRARALPAIAGEEERRTMEPRRNYRKWVLKFIDDLAAYLGGGKTDLRVLVRFIGEVPALDPEIVSRVRMLASDPEREGIVAASLRYLVQYRVPAKEMALDALQEVWQENQSFESPNAKLLTIHRPDFVEQKRREREAAAIVATV
ncbi:hypothetical protein EJ06DRAFT_498798 [Trichodelitschia bisporula]|uniref:Symplekin/Pta1 N-terminal domain-containing protein n=1 Tax=Trichodelitschia bisporula TaxID=703511 RepID=A0A6G1HNV8_9PEZI|nr:hypothetical protein EJ06DRAFT_498798 [Trichodelitschia bisporula]